MKRAELVKASAQQLFAAEDAVDKALCEIAKLAQTLGEGRMAVRLSAIIGQEAIDGVAVTYKRLSRARRDVVRLHHTLKSIQEQIGAGSVMVGPDEGKPPPKTGLLTTAVDNTKAA